jgi:hypothetical protein
MEKVGKPDAKLYPLPFCLRSPYRNLRSENSQDYAQKLNEIEQCLFINSASGQRDVPVVLPASRYKEILIEREGV